MSETSRDFKGIWIPAAIWLDDRLTTLDKCLLMEIDSLDNNENGCWASNAYLSEFCQCSERSVSRSIATLLMLGYLERGPSNGRTRSLRSCLAKLASPPRQNGESPSPNWRQNNIENNIENNKDYIPPILSPIHSGEAKAEKEPKKKFSIPTIKEIKAYAQSIDYNLDAEQFFTYYNDQEWKRNGKPMRSWKAAVHTWKHNDERRGVDTRAKPTRPTDEDLFAGLTAEQIAEYEQLANDGHHYG